MSSISVLNAGAGYLTPPVITLTGGGFITPATATAVLGTTPATFGTIVGIIVSGGSGYSSAPVVSIASPGRTGALTVNYTSPNTTGSLSYSLNPNAFGTALITVTVTDNGGTANGGINTVSQTFTVNVTAVNQPPTINPILVTPTVVENTTTPQTVSLTGIGVGPGNTGQTLTVTATTSNTALIPNLAVTYSPNNPTGLLSFVPAPFASGTATITVTVKENGGTATGTATTATQSFVVNVTAVNQAPTLGTIVSPLPIAENAGQQMVTISGLGVGPGDVGQTLSVSATSNNTALISSVGVNYTPNNPTGSLFYVPTAGQSGTALITVVVDDNGSTANGGVNFITQSFTVTVNPVNQAPTIGPIINPANPSTATATISGTSVASITVTNGGSGYLAAPTVTFIGGGSGPGFVAATATANFNNSGVITGITVNTAGAGYTSAPTISISSPASGTTATATATLTGTTLGSIAVNSSGTGYTFTPTVTLTGGGFITPASAVAVVSGGVITGITITNPGTGYTSAPTVAISNNFTALENITTPQMVNLSGITAGGNEVQSLNVFATSSNTALIPNPSVTYTSPGNSGTLSYFVLPNQSGMATITVTVMDNGGVANGGINTASQIFTVTVNPVNQAPTINPVTPPPAISESTSKPQTINLTGISAGPGQSENLTITAVSSNPGLIANPATTATATATLNGSGVGTVVVTADGNGYSFTPNVTITGGGGNGAAATAALNSSGVVTGINVTNGGSGYTSPPTVTIDPPLATAVDARDAQPAMGLLTASPAGAVALRSSSSMAAQATRARILRTSVSRCRPTAPGRWGPPS